MALCGFRAMRPAMMVASRARAVAALTVVAAAGLAGCTSPSSPAGQVAGATSTPVRGAPSPSPSPSPSAPSRPASAFRLMPARGPGHLAAGSDPSALPGDVLIADENNRRLLLVDPHGRIRWRFPGPGALRRGQAF